MNPHRRAAAARAAITRETIHEAVAIVEAQNSRDAAKHLLGTQAWRTDEVYRRNPYTTTPTVIGEVDQTPIGNTVLAIGEFLLPEPQFPNGSWTQSDRINLTPAEREILIAKLIQQRVKAPHPAVCAECGRYQTTRYRDLEPNQKYRVWYRPGTAKVALEAVLLYLGSCGNGQDTSWSARPYAGTQTLRAEQFVSAVQVPSDVPCYMERGIVDERDVPAKPIGPDGLCADCSIKTVSIV